MQEKNEEKKAALEGAQHVEEKGTTRSIPTSGQGATGIWREALTVLQAD